MNCSEDDDVAQLLCDISPTNEALEEEEEMQDVEDTWLPFENFLTERYAPPMQRGGPKNFQNFRTPLELFVCFLPLSFWTHVLVETNRYKNENDRRPQDRNSPNFSQDELSKFLGIIIFFGLRGVKGDKRACWSNDPLLGIPPIKEAMTRDRYESLRANLHLVNNALDTGEDSLFKVRPLISTFAQKCHEHYDLRGVVSLDEQVIRLYSRRVKPGIVQLFKHKPIKRGVRVESVNALDGFMITFVLSCDSRSINSTLSTHFESKGMKSRRAYQAAILQALQTGSFSARNPLLVICDNLYSSVELAKLWAAINVEMIGTWRSNFGVPDILKKARLTEADPIKAAVMRVTLKSGREDHAEAMRAYTEQSAARRGKRGRQLKLPQQRSKRRGRTRQIELLGVKIRGTGSKSGGFYMLSTSKRVTLTRENDSDPPMYDINRMYNSWMNGVDRFDQRRASYTIKIKPRRWWVQIFVWAVNAAIVNSYVVHVAKSSEESVLSHFDFRLKLIRSLLSGELFQSFKQQNVPRETPTKSKLEKELSSPRLSKKLVENAKQNAGKGVHFPARGSTRRRCQVCLEEGKEKRTDIICDMCYLPLCAAPCFRKFHVLNSQ